MRAAIGWWPPSACAACAAWGGVLDALCGRRAGAGPRDAGVEVLVAELGDEGMLRLVCRAGEGLGAPCEASAARLGAVGVV